jgi:hypothetical protein
MRSAVKSVKLSEAVESIDIEETMDEFDTNGFTKKIAIDDLPTAMRGLLKFPYIPNINVIDSIKYNPDKTQAIVQFKLNFKKLSELFLQKANTDRLIGSQTNKTGDRIVSFGLNNLRMIIVVQLDEAIVSDGTATSDEPEAKETKETTDVVKEGIDRYSNEDEYITPMVGELVQFYNKNSHDERRLEKEIIDRNYTDEDLRNLIFQLGVPNMEIPRTKDSHRLVSMLIDRIVGKNSIRESELDGGISNTEDFISAARISFEHVTADLVSAVSGIVSTEIHKDEIKKMKQNWAAAQKEIEKLLKGL